MPGVSDPVGPLPPRLQGQRVCVTIFSVWFGPVVTVTEMTEHLVVFGGAL